jgi:hypothetical protein
MKFKLILMTSMLVILLVPLAWSDQIVLKNGQGYSGKFIRGDANVVEFRILSRTETFKTADVAQIIFQEPMLDTSAATPARTEPAPAAPPIPAPSSIPPATQVASSQPVTPQVQVQGSGADAVTLPEGTSITIRTTAEINTERNSVGDTFEATLEDPLVKGDQTIAPKGTLVRGKISTVKESGKLTGQAELGLELTELVLNGKSYPLHTADYSEVGASRGQRTATTVGGTAALGAIIGAIAGGGKGAAIGAASGAAVGTGVQIMTKGQKLEIPSETILEFKLDYPLSITGR